MKDNRNSLLSEQRADILGAVMEQHYLHDAGMGRDAALESIVADVRHYCRIHGHDFESVSTAALDIYNIEK